MQSTALTGPLLLIAAVGIAASIATAQNLVTNASFEASAETAEGRTLYLWHSDHSEIRLVTDGARSGEHAVAITSFDDNDARLHQTVSVRPNRSYRLAIWVKTQFIPEATKGACLSLLGRMRTSNDLRGTHEEWTEVAFYARTGPGVTELTYAFGLGGYGSLGKGKAMFDDASVKEVVEIPFDEAEEYIGPVAGDRGDPEALDTALDFLERYDAGCIGPLGGVIRYDWRAAPSIEAAQTALRGAFVRDVLGAKPAYRQAPGIEGLFREELSNAGLERSVVLVDGEPGYGIKCCILRPLRDGPLPAIVFAHGAGGCIADCCGFGRKTYHNDCMFETAKRGYVTVTYAVRGLGTDDFGAPGHDPMTYDDIVGYTLNRGSCAMSVWIHDGLQVIDAIAPLNAVDAKRIAFAGMSHGGQIAMYAGAIAPERVAAVIAMGSMISFDTIYSEVHNMTGHALPNVARQANMGDLGGLVAPRPMLIQWGELEKSGRATQLRPSSLAEFDQAQWVYERLGAADAIVQRVTPGMGHGWDVAVALRFLDDHL